MRRNGNEADKWRKRRDERLFGRKHARDTRLHIDLALSQQLDHALMLGLMRIVMESVVKLGRSGQRL